RLYKRWVRPEDHRQLGARATTRSGGAGPPTRYRAPAGGGGAGAGGTGHWDPPPGTRLDRYVEHEIIEEELRDQGALSISVLNSRLPSCSARQRTKRRNHF